jgi:voltage-gated potassium channel
MRTISFSFSAFARMIQQSVSDPIRRFRIALLLLLFLACFGTAGYMVIEGMSFIDAFYMTVITVATIGFGEVHPLSPEGKIFTIIFIILSVGTGAWVVSAGIEILLGDRVWVQAHRRRTERILMELKNHYIVCGYGRMGRQIVRDLVNRSEKFVIIESSPGMEKRLLDTGHAYILGDAEDDEVLKHAGVERAQGIVAALNSDAANVLIALSARGLNPDILIVARSSNEYAESKLRRAGADRVVSPDAIGGHRLALALLQPTVHDFMTKIFNIEELDVDVGEVVVPDGSAIIGKSIIDLDIRGKWGLSIIAIQSASGEFIISPDATRRIVSGETLIVIGPLSAIEKFDASTGTTTP